MFKPSEMFFLKSITQMKRLFCQSMKRKITLDGQTINYVVAGTGPKKLLCFPGAIGTIWSDFKPQLTGLDQNKFTVIAWDPPGYGHSRPPNRKFAMDFYETDADMASKLMTSLNIETYSMLGWSDGGISSLIMAAKYPAQIEKLVVWGANAYLTAADIKTFEAIRDVDKWSERMKKPLIDLYGEELFRTMWANWCDVMVDIHVKCQGNICRELLKDIKCPTLILHGAKDPMVPREHPEYLNKHIVNSRLVVYPDGKHNIHLRYAAEFNKEVTEFIA